jgi:hypothetical protein
MAHDATAVGERQTGSSSLSREIRRTKSRSHEHVDAVTCSLCGLDRVRARGTLRVMAGVSGPAGAASQWSVGLQSPRLETRFFLTISPPIGYDFMPTHGWWTPGVE